MDHVKKSQRRPREKIASCYLFILRWILQSADGFIQSFSLSKPHATGSKPQTPTFPVRLEQPVFQDVTCWRMAGEETKQTGEIYFSYIPALRLVCFTIEGFFK